jgi:hypothetical protein
VAPVSDEIQDPLLSFDAEGQLQLWFGLMNERFREAMCCECGEPIQWVLDMFSFKHNDRGSFDLGHAWCLWTPEGFDNAKARASEASPSETREHNA